MFKLSGYILLLSTCLCFFFNLSLTAQEDFPVLYKGRFRPADSYARLWLYDLYQSQNIKDDDLLLFNASSTSALQWLFKVDLIGSDSFQDAPLFWASGKVRKTLQLDLSQKRFSFAVLDAAIQAGKHPNTVFNKEVEQLAHSLELFQSLKKPTLPSSYTKRLLQLQSESFSPEKIESILEREFPPLQRIRMASPLFKALPGKNQEWFPLKALELEAYSKKTNQLRPIANFTRYLDSDFEQIRKMYLILKAEVENGKVIQKHLDSLTTLLKEAYGHLAGTVHQEAEGKALYYPTLKQLWAEYQYYQYPWIKFLIFLYGVCTLLFICSSTLQLSQPIRNSFFCLLLTAFLLHTAMLLWRVYILQRPPVSNMFETVIYVPWITVFFGLLLGLVKRNTLPFLASSLATVLLLLLLELTSLNHSLDQVQAVLDSQFWLIIHVLMVVGSYGIFLLGSILGHFYLAFSLYYARKTPSMRLLAQLILQSLYAGTTFLIIGTLLGGVWAAESWGRFWDWDPKESWAFISICIYLIGIHAYRFQRIGDFGLAFGAVSGFLAISFTWYGVNYILGTGLHSYGFGSGGEIYYYSFLLVEIIFLSAALLSNTKKRIVKI
ncbi:MAG: cytochrome c biogenesis protein CcsA [Candidatus Protochlamydia sp.]|nr:cytochrome c biogenesis protein CcsA [Candidatus Protochlamydia sp.]